MKPSKPDGLGRHAHRHSYGRRLTRAGVKDVVIKKCLHHASINSQEVYTTPTNKEITAILNAATAQLLNSEKQIERVGTPSWEVLTQHDFNDIDPENLFTGKHPKLGRVL